MNAPGALGRPLLGDAGYRRLVRLVARAFYAGECPPPPPPDPSAPLPPPGSRFHKHSFVGLGIVLLDYLATRADGFVDEMTVCEDVRLSQKQVRRVLKHLEDAGVVHSEVVKYSRIVSAGDDPEVAPRRRAETHAFWAIDYARVKDSLRLRLARMRETLRKAAEDTDALQQYACPRCGATYSSLDAVRLLDPRSGAFVCEECGTELRSGEDDAAMNSTAPRRSQARSLLERMEVQLAPIVDQLDRLKEADPPDPGSLQDWFLAQREAAQRRKASLEAARRRATGPGGTAGLAGDKEDLSVDQLLDIVDAATVEVKVAGVGSPSAGSDQVTGPDRKELPAWFKSNDVPEAGETAALEQQDAEAEAERRRQLEAAYIAQYMEAVQRAAAAGGAQTQQQGKRATVAPLGDMPESKRVKVEEVKEEEEVKVEEESDALQSADFEWEDM